MDPSGRIRRSLAVLLCAVVLWWAEPYASRWRDAKISINKAEGIIEYGFQGSGSRSSLFARQGDEEKGVFLASADWWLEGGGSGQISFNKLVLWPDWEWILRVLVCFSCCHGGRRREMKELWNSWLTLVVLRQFPICEHILQRRSRELVYTLVLFYKNQSIGELAACG